MTDWSWLERAPEVCAVDDKPASEGICAPWPSWVLDGLRARLTAQGISALWTHQAAAADEAFHGRHVAITTATGSGKSLGYLLPIIAATAEDQIGVPKVPGRLRMAKPTAIYLAPTKALARDQWRAAKALGPRNWPVIAVDGDSTEDERRAAREVGTFVLTNPDMLHYSILPAHRHWSRLLSGLRYLVVDEAHRYQGVFGAHVAHVLRRLRRIAHHYGADPTVILASGTAPGIRSFGQALTGIDTMVVVDKDGAPKPRRTTLLWRPSISLNRDTSMLLGRLVTAGVQTIAFTASRVGAEVVAREAQEIGGQMIASYRSGYLPAERRELERALASGKLRGIAATNALELGIDIAGMDAVLVAGYPGRLTALWQQAGRAGRRGQDALVVLLARDNPLDSFLFEHPDVLLHAPVEHPVLYPGNPHVMGLHLAAAAQELPLTAADARWFGDQAPDMARALAKQGVLRDRRRAFYWTRTDRAVDFIFLRSSNSRPFDIIERDTGRIVGTVDEGKVDSVVHEGAVYLHQGESFVVDELILQDRQALVHAARPKYYTQPQSSFEIEVLSKCDEVLLGAMSIHRGEVQLTSQVVSYLRRDEQTHDVWDQTPLSLPSRSMCTQAIWWTVPDGLATSRFSGKLQLGAALHAMEHTAIGLLPAFAPCDRWDLGGVSTACHLDTGLPTVFIYDGLAGGAGFAYRGFDIAKEWLEATLERLQRCACEAGCPSCVVSPKCGNANQALSKSDAAALLAALLFRER